MSLLRALGLPPPPAKGASASPPGSAAQGTPAGAPQKSQRLAQAAETWRKTHALANERIAALKAAVTAHHADGHPALLAEIEKGLAQLDDVLDNVDHRLADSLAHASSTADDGAQAAELKNAKAILTEYLTYVQGERLIAHMDENPFGVKTGLKALLATGLTDAAKAIG
jgi:hypothetical protein